MRRISSWGAFVFLVCWPYGEARAEGLSAGSMGLGLTVAGAATTVVSAAVVATSYSCRGDGSVPCPGRADKTAGIVGLIAGVAMLGIGIPLYVMSPQEGNDRPANRVASELAGASMQLRF